MKNLVLWILISSIYLSSSQILLSGQEKIVEGYVTTFDSIPLIGATIMIKSTKELVSTDSLGKFSLSCNSKDKLIVNAQGFSRRSVKIKEEVRVVLVNLKLIPGPENRELAIAYGHVKDADKLYAISNINTNDIDFSNYSSIYDVLSARFSSSVQVKSNGDIIIRGGPSVTGSNAAVLIVDGIETNAFGFGSINTSEIASINVLKDASASMYGSRGSNGAVVVETKHGKDN